MRPPERGSLADVALEVVVPRGREYGIIDLFAVSLVTHPFHGPWSYEGGVCHGCGVGLDVTISRTMEA